ncbi:MAG: DUF2336 domain-containing protein [Sphingobium sp.]
MSGPSPARNWGIVNGPRSLPVALSVAAGGQLRHALALERCFGGPEMRWSDILIARMRRHAGGCVTAVEIALRLEMTDRFPALAPLVEAVADGHCWRQVQEEPSLLGAALLDHFRDRAAIGLMQQDDILDVAGEMTEADIFPRGLVDSLTALLLGQTGWADNGPDETSMRADLPAEMMTDLVWTVAAIFADALIRQGAASDAGIVQMVDLAGNALAGRHDEEGAPFALASLIAHRLRGEKIGDDHLLSLARGRQVLLLLAIIADRTGIDLLLLVRTVVEGTEQTLFTLCRAADFPREVAVRLVLGRRCVARGVDDSVLVEFADRYDHLSVEEAVSAVSSLCAAQPLRAKLSLLDRMNRA